MKAFAQALQSIWAALREPEVLQAFQLTPLIRADCGSGACVLWQYLVAGVGALTAWAQTAHRLIDTPFAISQWW